MTVIESTKQRFNLSKVVELIMRMIHCGIKASVTGGGVGMFMSLFEINYTVEMYRSIYR